MDEFSSPPLTPEIQKVLNIWASKIDELKFLGSKILKKDLEKQNGGDENLPFYFMLRHTIELLDSISIQIRSSSVVPCKLILRGLLENYFHLEYLTKDDWERKAYQFIGTTHYSKLKFYRKLDPNHRSHIQFKNPFEQDKRIDGYPFTSPPNLDKAIKNLERLFNRKNYKPILAEIKRLSKNNIKNPPWYRLFNGPKNIYSLAQEVNLGGLYETYYRFWSRPIHGTDIMDNNFTVDKKGRFNVYQIRLPFEAQPITWNTITISRFIYETYIDLRLPAEKAIYQKWYSENQDFYKKLGEKNIIVNSDLNHGI